MPDLRRTRPDPARRPSATLAFRLGDELYGLPVASVEEVLPALPLETVPGGPAFLRGVVFVRGHLIPVLDAAERLGRRGKARGADPPIVCLRFDGRYVGLEVDEVLDLLDLTGAAPLAADEIGAGGGFFTGLVERDGRVIRMLDPSKLVAREEAARLESLPRTAARPAESS